jgi:hypothetical protein
MYFLIQNLKSNPDNYEYKDALKKGKKKDKKGKKKDKKKKKH